MTVEFFFYPENVHTQTMSDIERIGARIDSFYLIQDGGWFFVYASADHANSFDHEYPALFAINTGKIKDYDLGAAMDARRIVHNALCTYGKVTFETC